MCERARLTVMAWVGFSFATISLGLAFASCYPTKCDPLKDPTGCKCPDGACGPYPGEAKVADAGLLDAGKDSRP